MYYMIQHRQEMHDCIVWAVWKELQGREDLFFSENHEPLWLCRVSFREEVDEGIQLQFGRYVSEREGDVPASLEDITDTPFPPKWTGS